MSIKSIFFSILPIKKLVMLNQPDTDNTDNSFLTIIIMECTYCFNNAEHKYQKEKCINSLFLKRFKLILLSSLIGILTKILTTQDFNSACSAIFVVLALMFPLLKY